MHGHLNVKKNPGLLRNQLSFQKGRGYISAVTPRSTPGATRSIVLMIATDGTATTKT